MTSGIFSGVTGKLGELVIIIIHDKIVMSSAISAVYPSLAGAVSVLVTQ